MNVFYSRRHEIYSCNTTRTLSIHVISLVGNRIITKSRKNARVTELTKDFQKILNVGIDPKLVSVLI